MAMDSNGRWFMEDYGTKLHLVRWSCVKGATERTLVFNKVGKAPWCMHGFGENIIMLLDSLGSWHFCFLGGTLNILVAFKGHMSTSTSGH